jgi:hypothetical protein
MGQEVNCTAQWEGKSVRGKALLETSEILFRGEERLKIPFSSIRRATSEDGELRLQTDRGLVIFELGDRAQKWREKIANPKSVVEKLGVKPGEKVSVFGRLESEFLQKLKKQKSLIEKGKISADASCIFLGVATHDDLREVKRIMQKLKGSTALWVVYPKGQKSLTEVDVIGAGRNAGLKDVKVVGFNTTHTALKFVIPVDQR